MFLLWREPRQEIASAQEVKCLNEALIAFYGRGQNYLS